MMFPWLVNCQISGNYLLSRQPIHFDTLRCGTWIGIEQRVGNIKTPASKLHRL